MKVEKVWEKEFPGAERVIWGESEIGINDDVPQTAYVLETNGQQNTKRIIYPKVVILNRLIRIMNYSGQVTKEIPGLIFMGKSEDNKYIIVGMPVRELTEYESEKNMSVPWQATVYDDQGNELWKPEPRMFGRVQPLSENKLIDFEQFAGGGSSFSIVSRSGDTSTIRLQTSDYTIPEPIYAISEKTNIIVGVIGSKKPELVKWDENGKEILRKTLPISGYYCGTVIGESRYDKMHILKLNKLPKYESDGRPDQKVLFLNSNGELMDQVDLERPGNYYFMFSENDLLSGLVYLERKRSRIIVKDGKTQIIEFGEIRSKLKMNYDYIQLIVQPIHKTIYLYGNASNSDQYLIHKIRYSQ